MANMTVCDRGQMDRAALSENTGVRIGRVGRHMLSAYLVIASAVLGLLLVWAAQVFDGWHHLIVIADLVVVLFGIAAWVDQTRTNV
jgi:hypothetical protein